LRNPSLNLRSFILPTLKTSIKKIAYYRPNNTCSRNISCKWYSTFRYFLCTSTDLYFKKKEKYEQHSKDLVDALYKWVDSISFPACEYVDGSLKFHDYSTNDEIPLLKQAKFHLDKSYPHILKIHDNTKNDCIKLCERIKEIIKAQDNPSFENIIITKINTECPNFKSTHKNNLKEYSNQSAIYTDNDVFDIIFKNQSLDEDDLDVKEDNDKLIYQNFKNIAQGEKSDKENLKQTIIELISNKEIKKFIEEYHNLHNELENKSESFKKEIRDLYYSVNGGMTLEKEKNCDICKSF